MTVFIPKPCEHPFQTESYVPKFGDIVHCRGDKGDRNPCRTAWVVLTAQKTSFVSCDLVSLGEYQSAYFGTTQVESGVCSLAPGSAWHLAEAYAPAE